MLKVVNFTKLYHAKNFLKLKKKLIDLCLPANSTEFIVSISKQIAATEPSLTIEFLNECIMGYGKSEQGVRYLCLLYMIPWLPNLALYCGKSTEDQGRLKDLLRLLIDLTLPGEVRN